MGIDIVDITGCNSTGRPTPDETVKAKKLSPPKRAIYYLQPFKHRTHRDPYITHMRMLFYVPFLCPGICHAIASMFSSLFSINIAIITAEIMYYLNSNNLKPLYHVTCYFICF